MAKYFIAFVLLAVLALETNSIYSRVHARSSTSSAELETVAHYTQQYPNQLQHTQSHHQKRKHHAKHHNHLHRRDVRPSDLEDAEAERRRYMHLLRHMQRQNEHQKHHQDQYNHATTLDLMKLPHAWQHLEKDYDNMLNDEPHYQSKEELDSDFVDNRKYQELNLHAEIPPPLPTELKFLEESQPSHSHSQEKIQQSVEMASAERGDYIEKRPVPTGCPKCESDRSIAHVTEEELTSLRIEFVKQQILEKLRLKERPNISAVSLPKPISEGTTIEHEDEESKSKELDDYYARTSKKFIVLKRETTECQRLSNQPSMCFSFKIDDADADGFDVSTAVLWLHRNKQNKQKPRNHTIVVAEVQQQLDSTYLPLIKTIAIQSVDAQDEWMKIDIVWPIKRWFGNHELSHLIHVSCQSCDIDSMTEIISLDKDYSPFIMVDTQNRRLPSRQKRSINCTNGVTECCREKLYISFDDIGWGDWIIQPRGYDAYFCRGSCSSIASVAQSATHHSTFMQKMLSTSRGNGRKPLELIPCCTAKQYSSLQLVFMDSNNTATQKTFPNMVVESCGCR